MTKKDTKKEEAPRLARLKPTRFTLASSNYTRWYACPTTDEEYEDILNPEYWTHSAARVRPCDIIEVVPEDMSYRAELFVVSCGPTHIKVKEVTKIDLSGEGVEETSTPYRVKFNGPHDRFTVFRGEEKVQAGFATEDEAVRHISTLSGKAA